MAKWKRNLSKTKRWNFNALVERDGNICYLCLIPILNRHDMTVDHLIARSNGGSDDLSNLRIAHEKCNYDKKNLPLEEYVAIQEGF